jgi:hypothetical protein
MFMRIFPDLGGLLHDFTTFHREETGSQLWMGNRPDAAKELFLKSSIRDLLDNVSLVHQFLLKSHPLNASEWLTLAGRIFREENLTYRVGEDGIVHPFFDGEFEVNRISAVEALNDQRFGEAREDFEAAYRHLRDGNRKEALRMMFPAVEVAAKVLFPGKFAGLAPNEVEKHIRPALERRYQGNQPAIDAGRRLLEGMKAWINAAQLYRHGQEQQEPAEPPIDFVIAHLSAGATYLRWMIEICSEATEPVAG